MSHVSWRVEEKAPRSMISAQQKNKISCNAKICIFIFCSVLLNARSRSLAPKEKRQRGSSSRAQVASFASTLRDTVEALAQRHHGASGRAHCALRREGERTLGLSGSQIDLNFVIFILLSGSEGANDKEPRWKLGGQARSRAKAGTATRRASRGS